MEIACIEQWGLQRLLETAESNGDCRDYWRLQRAMETAESSGSCKDQWGLLRLVKVVATTGDYWKLQKLLQTPELLKPVEDAKTDGDWRDHDKLTIVSNNQKCLQY